MQLSGRFFIYLFTIACCWSGTAFSQISDSLLAKLPDSLKPKNKKLLTSREKQAILSDANVFFAGNAADKELTAMANSLDKEASLTNDPDLRINDTKALADYYFYSPFSQEKGLDYYNKLIGYIGNNEYYNPLLASANLGIGSFYMYHKQDSAIKYLHIGLDIAKEQNDSALLVATNQIYSVIYGMLRLFDKSIYYNEEVLRSYPVNEQWNINYTKNMLSDAILYGLYCEQTGIKKYADSAYGKVYHIMQVKKNEAASWYGACYYFLGYFSYINKNYATAISLFDSSMLPVYNTSSMYFVNYDYGRYLYKAVCLFKLGKYREGKLILDTLRIPPSRFNHLKIMNEALYEYYASMGSWKMALEYYQQYKRYSDSIDLEGQKGKIFETEQKYLVSEKEAEVKSLTFMNEVEKKDKKIIVLSGVGVVLLLFFVILLLYNRAQKRRHETELAIVAEKLATEQKLFLQGLDAQLTMEKAIESLRQTISRDMHDGLSGGLAGLKYYVNDMKLRTQPGPQQDLLQEVEGELNNIYLQARAYMHNLQQGMGEVHYDVCTYLQSLSSGFNKNLGLTIQVNADYGKIHACFTSLQHSQLTLALKEIINNVLKHAQATIVQIDIGLHNNQCRFMISDNGKGFSASDMVPGIGLASIRTRIQQLHGTVDITGGNNGGTMIEGSFPV